MRATIARWREGFIRRLCPSEVNRGYVYISRNKELQDLLCVDNFEVKIAETLLVARRIDGHGRIQIPCKLLRELGSNKLLQFEIVSKDRMEIVPIEDNQQSEN